MYAPLELLRQSPNTGHEFETIRQQYTQMGIKAMDGLSEGEFVDFLLSDDFLNPRYHGELSDVNDLLFRNVGIVEKVSGLTAEEMMQKNYRLDTEWRDILLAPCLFDRWSMSKQVFKPDPDFADALLHTKKLQYTKEIIGTLRTPVFYIDLEDCKQFAPVIGAFVYVGKQENGCSIAIYLLTAEMTFFSNYSSFRYGDENGVRFEENDLPDKGFDIYIPVFGTGVSTKEQQISRQEASFFSMQMICYLSSQKPDITEDPVTQKTYRPYAKPKNKFSEVQRIEVGVRYGNILRTKIAKELKNTTEEENSPGTLSSKKNRKSPCPHFRCAHWQRYWVGEGRKKCEVKWIEPTFVGLDKGDGVKNAVIHRVRI